MITRVSSVLTVRRVSSSLASIHLDQFANNYGTIVGHTKVKCKMPIVDEDAANGGGYGDAGGADGAGGDPFGNSGDPFGASGGDPFGSSGGASAFSRAPIVSNGW